MEKRTFLRLGDAAALSNETTVLQYIAAGKSVRYVERPYIPRPPVRDLTWQTRPNIDFRASTLVVPWIRKPGGPIEDIPTRIDIPADKFKEFIRPADVVTHRRVTGDDELVSQALAGIKSGKWPNQNAASLDLAQSAAGAGTLESRANRLRKKIRAAIRGSQVRPNKSKD